MKITGCNLHRSRRGRWKDTLEPPSAEPIEMTAARLTTHVSGRQPASGAPLVDGPIDVEVRWHT